MVEELDKHKEQNSDLIPRKEILDFEKLAETYPIIGDKEKFVKRMKLCLGESTKFPKYFPGIVNLPKAGANEVTMSKNVMDAYLQLPAEMFDGEMYEIYPELRRPVEQIIYEYQRVRHLYGLELAPVEGEGWHSEFLRKIENLNNPKVGPIESQILDETMEDADDEDEQIELSTFGRTKGRREPL